MNITKNAKILITGGKGFLGKYVIKELVERGYINSLAVDKEYDLRKSEYAKAVVLSAEYVIHLAAKVGGIMENITYPADFFYDNVLMGVNIIHESAMAKVKKLVYVGTVCSYPAKSRPLFEENEFWSGYPDKTNAAYGMSKKIALPMLLAYRKQFNLNGVYPVLTNLYGTGDKSTHVIPDMIRKFKENPQEVTFYGSGKQTREFLHVEDAARAIVDVLEKYDSPKIINIGTGLETSIRELANTMAKIMKYKGKIIWDTSKPEGNVRRVLDTRRAYEKFGWKAKVSMKEGLEKTIKSYE